MSERERPDLAALGELQMLVRHLGEELASFRKRALSSEARLRQLEATPGGAEAAHFSERVTELEGENALLREQLTTAQAGVKGMLDRVRFLRQQAEGAQS